VARHGAGAVRHDEETVTEGPAAPQTALSIDLLSTLALRGVLTEVAEDFHARTGLAIAPTYKSTNAVLELIAQGRTADATIVTREAIDRLTREGIIAPGTTANIARSGVGIAVQADAPRPDISTVTSFKRALLAARSVAFSRQGASGIHFAQVIAQLGIADEIRRKATISDSYVGELAARGEVEIVVQQISELKPVVGIDIVGPLPGELQKISTFAAGVFKNATNPDEAARLIAYLSAPAIVPVLVAKGLEAP
jgi:molybdate transport system substrate-binding protein